MTTNAANSTNPPRYPRSRDLSGSMQGAGGIGGLLAVDDDFSTDDGDYLVFYDANGNVGQLMVVSPGGSNPLSAGDIAARYEYLPYGGMEVVAGNYSTRNPFRFSTKFFDTGSRTYYYGYRWHYPQYGRWLSRDPISGRGGVNVYAVVGNSPIGFFDPTGLKRNSCGCCCCAKGLRVTFLREFGNMHYSGITGTQFGHEFTVTAWLGWKEVKGADKEGRAIARR